MKVAIHYFFYSVGFFSAIFIVLRVQRLLKEHMGETYNLLPYIIYTPLLYIIIGLLLGVPTLFKEKSKSGKWSIKLEKLVFVAVPSLYIAFYPLIYAKIRFLMLPTYMSTAILSSDIYLIAALIFGFILITTLEKTKEPADVHLNV